MSSKCLGPRALTFYCVGQKELSSVFPGWNQSGAAISMSAGNKNSPYINSEDPPKPYLTIEPSNGFRSLRLRDIWEFREMLGMRDIGLFVGGRGGWTYPNQ